MNIILGFGDTEKRFEEKLENSLIENIVENYSMNSDDYFTDDFIAETKKYIADAAKNSQEQAESYKEAVDYPHRYSRFWGYVLGDCNHIAIILTLHHINRRHAMSPDGWGMMQSERVFHIAALDIKNKKATA